MASTCEPAPRRRLQAPPPARWDVRSGPSQGHHALAKACSALVVAGEFLQTCPAMCGPASVFAGPTPSTVQVAAAAVPPGISMATAEAVLFVGKAVRALRQPVSCGPSAGPLQPCAEPPLAEGAAGAACEHGGGPGAGPAGMGELLGGQAAEAARRGWAADLRRLAAAPSFSALDFEATVQRIRAQVLRSLRCWHRRSWLIVALVCLMHQTVRRPELRARPVQQL